MKTLLLGSVIAMLSFQPPAPFHPRHASRTVCDANEFCSLTGYVILTCSSVTGEFEGADFDKLVELDNGMIFRFQEYKYSYSYRPDVVVLATATTYQGQQLTLYKLLIEDELYDVRRVK